MTAKFTSTALAALMVASAAPLSRMKLHFCAIKTAMNAM